MIALVHEAVAPEDFAAVDEEDAGHDPRVTNRAADEISLRQRPHAAGPDLDAEHLAEGGAAEAKGGVKLLRLVGDRPRVGPVVAEKRLAFLDRPLVEKQHRRKSGHALCELAKVPHHLAAEH